MEFKLTISEELIKTIESMGYDLHSYFDEVFTKPLVAKHRTALEAEVVAIAQPEIDEKIDKAQRDVSLEEVKEKPIEEPVPEPDPEPKPEDPPVDETPVEDTPIEP